MLTLITVLHLVVALLIIVLVLVQDSKGDGMGTTFGGGGGNSGTVLGATGAVSFLSKATRVIVVVFAATAIILTRMTAADQGSVLDRVSGSNPANSATSPSPTGPATTNSQVPTVPKATAGASATPIAPAVTEPAAGSIPGTSTPGTEPTKVPAASKSPTPAAPTKQ